MRVVSRSVLAFACALPALSTAACQRSLKDACDELAAAQCARRAACSMAPNPERSTCERTIVTRCVNWPDLPGASLGADDIAACAEAYEGHPCESLIMGARPSACRFAGKASNGAKCVAGAECQSTYCKPDADGHCGECSAIRNEGDTCSKGGSPCAAGLYCSQAGKCVAYGTKGDPCGAVAPCNLLHWCDERGTCAPQVGEGEPCTRGDQCSLLDRLACDRTSGLCEARDPTSFSSDGEATCD